MVWAGGSPPAPGRHWPSPGRAPGLSLLCLHASVHMCDLWDSSEEQIPHDTQVSVKMGLTVTSVVLDEGMLAVLRGRLGIAALPSSSPMAQAGIN